MPNFSKCSEVEAEKDIQELKAEADMEIADIKPWKKKQVTSMT